MYWGNIHAYHDCRVEMRPQTDNLQLWVCESWYVYKQSQRSIFTSVHELEMHVCI